MEGPTLDRFILSGFIEDEHKSRVLVDMAHAMQYLHSLRPAIVHGDLKPGNVFVEVREGDIICKLADFGLARRVTISAQNMGGTLRWAAPELVFGDKKASMKADIYSLGQVMYFILTGRRPYQGLATSEIHSNMRRNMDPTEKWPSGHLSKLLKPCIEHCRRTDPTERLAAMAVAEVLETIATTPGGRRSIHSEGSRSPKTVGVPGVVSLHDVSDELMEGNDLDNLDVDALLCAAFRRARQEVNETIN
mmetsp:Transcript_23032/g.54744  ORF Transcript_23032/g.54744 Transcript_23032/m.54744 type:complete len:248 (+) Transcript_23032:44-787(+)